eukprot:513003_1
MIKELQSSPTMSSSYNRISYSEYEELQKRYNSAQSEINILQKKADILQKHSQEQNIHFGEIQLRMQYEYDQKEDKYNNKIAQLQKLLSHHVQQSNERKVIIEKLKTEHEQYKNNNDRLTAINKRQKQRINNLLASNNRLISEALNTSDELERNNIELNELREFNLHINIQTQNINMTELNIKSSYSPSDTLYILSDSVSVPNTIAKSSATPPNNGTRTLFTKTPISKMECKSNSSTSESSKGILYKYMSNTETSKDKLDTINEHIDANVDNLQFATTTGFDDIHEQDFIEKIKQEWDEMHQREIQDIKEKYELEIKQLRLELNELIEAKN